jgi:hypothetical protein
MQLCFFNTTQKCLDEKSLGIVGLWGPGDYSKKPSRDNPSMRITGVFDSKSLMSGLLHSNC